MFCKKTYGTLLVLSRVVAYRIPLIHHNAYRNKIKKSAACKELRLSKKVTSKKPVHKGINAGGGGAMGKCFWYTSIDIPDYITVRYL